MSRYPVFDTASLRLEPLERRGLQQSAADCLPLRSPAAPPPPSLLPVAEAVRAARAAGRPCVLMLGAHPVKLGLNRFLVDLVERRLVTHVATNGAGVIHDYELALAGGTSEDVARWLPAGQFGLWQETSRLNAVIAEAARRGEGIGEAVGRTIEEEEGFPHRALSLAAACWRTGTPLTCHVTVGADIIHAHPGCDGAALGAASLTDFLVFARSVQGLEGGVFLNVGSAVTGPEVFLKALSMARNAAHQRGEAITDFTTAVFDLIALPPGWRDGLPGKDDPFYYCRGFKTVLVRAVAGGGRSHHVQGDHRETIPALWSLLVHGVPAATDANAAPAPGAATAASPASIQEMYPPVPVSLLVADEWQQRFREMFLDSGEYDADPFTVASRTERPHRKCVSVCLFRQNTDNRRPREFPFDEERFRRKYWDGLLAMAAAMPRLPDWKLRVYAEKSVRDEAHAALGANPQVEVHGMAVDSVGANPGSLWRLLAFADPSLDLVASVDIDDPLEEKLGRFAAFALDPQAALGRVGGFRSGQRFLVSPGESEAKNYATVVGNCVMARPALFDFDPAAAMRGFMAYRKSMSMGGSPWAYADGEKPSPYNMPIGGHLFGWGSHWHTYCFDERFLKHVLYYHFAEKGSMQTWAESVPPERMDPEGVLDLRYAREKGNATVDPRTVARLAPLGLDAEALRIAFRLDEWRWVFERLLALMREHSGTGFCGNLFFHDIKDPWFIELVPKQVNLFDASRRASRALEIGFNAGHSAAVMLLANPRLTIRAFDTCGHSYVRPCLDFLNGVFGGRIAMVEGRSQDTLPRDPVTGYDLLHVDGDHSFAAVAADLANALPKCVPGAVVAMDDHEAGNEVAQATSRRQDLVPTDAYTRRAAFPGSSHAFFHLRKPGGA